MVFFFFFSFVFERGIRRSKEGVVGFCVVDSFVVVVVGHLVERGGIWKKG